MKILVVIDSNDAETVWNALRFATTSLVYDNPVTIFLLGRGVEAASVSTLTFDTHEQLDLFRNSGGILIGCGVCCESRKKEMPYLQAELQCETGSMQQLYGLVAEADKVLTF
jgi:hypothetical protein